MASKGEDRVLKRIFLQIVSCAISVFLNKIIYINSLRYKINCFSNFQIRKNAMRQRSLLLTLVLLIAAGTASNDDSEKTLSQNHVYQLIPNEIKEEYIRHISSIMNAYRSDVMGGRLIVETNSQVDTRYRTWKRNADLINSLLALPKVMNEAGR